MIYNFFKKIKKSTRRFRKGFFIRNWLAGRIIEILGNKGYVSGMKFDLKNPYIETFLKCRFLFNTYESGAEELIKNHVKSNLPVIEFGGCIGVISCLTNKKLKNKNNHIVVEAQPYLIDTLKKNRDENNCHFKIIHAALAYNAQIVDFWINKKFFIGNSTKIRTDAEGTVVKVPSISLENIVKENKFDKITLIVDIEGAETELINNELKFMIKVVDTLIIELHSAEWGAGYDAINKLKQDLKGAGFLKIDQKGSDYIYKNQNI
tara:strand:+ start:1174 stop:1962 length:789 start_codon:yes stop_codon:yes gene_type:complete